MAISLKEMSDRPNTNYMEFVVDTIAEIDTLPTTVRTGTGQLASIGAIVMGSSAYCFEDRNVYGLSSNGWKVM